MLITRIYFNSGLCSSKLLTGIKESVYTVEYSDSRLSKTRIFLVLSWEDELVILK